MPEGDTIFRAARTLNRALAGKIVTKFETALAHLARTDDDSPLAGRSVERVDAVGKWMRIYFSGDLILLTHMLMSGSWHIYRAGEPWQRGRSHMRAAIHAADFVAVAFDVPIAEFHTAASLARHRAVPQLGPNVLGAHFDEAEAAARLRSRSDLEIGVAIMRQRLVAGMGNIFKSEVCFAARVNPFRKVGALTDEELRSLMIHARRLMSANITETSGPGIVTYAGMNRAGATDNCWVYQRQGQSCRRCGTRVESRKQGEEARTTYWCPRCQPA
jgi:endonuclease-8